MSKLEISISSKIDNITLIENFIEDLNIEFKLSSNLYGRLTLAIIEAVNNAILHGNKRDPTKFVTVVANKMINQLKVIINDEGEGFDFTVIPDPTLPDTIRKITGRGLYLMQSLSDQMIFENNGTSVILVFNF